MDDVLSNELPRHRPLLGITAALAGAVTMILLSAFTALPKDLVAAAGVVVMRLAYSAYWLEAQRRDGRAARRGWFVVETFVAGLAVVGFYRVAEQLFGVTWR